MRVGLVCPYSLTIPGGVQAQVLGLGRTLRERGHEARVLGPCDGPPPESFVTPLGNSIPTSANGSVAPLAPDPSAAMRTIRALRDERFDVVHVHEPLAPGPTLTTVITHPAPIVGTFHAAGRSGAYRWLNPLVRMAASRIDVRCAVSVEARELAAKAIGGDFEMVFNGIEVDRFHDVDAAPDGERTICFIGRHEPRKGLRVLLDAMSHLPADVKLWVASDGPETAELRAAYAADHRISWLGRLSDREKVERLRGAAVFCAPSLRGESFGVVLLEAMAAHTPIVASDLTGYRLVARPDSEALIVEPGNSIALAAALRRVLDDPALADRLRRAGDRRAEEFSMDALAVRYEEIYERVTRRSRR
ncbi:MAG: glycosyltransferase family 4 protein [Acidimicrobiia bacterium]